MARATLSPPSRFDAAALMLLLVLCAWVGGRLWLHEHPEHDPCAPLDLRDPPGWATHRKLAQLRSDPQACRAVLDRSGVAFEVLEPAGEGQCLRVDRVVLEQAPLSPSPPPTTCAVAAGLQRWLDQSVQPAARTLLKSPVARIEHLGAYSCRRLYGRSTGDWSQHAQGNAIDIAAFVLKDGRRVAVLKDWQGDDAAARFLRQVRDGACRSFSTVLSPDYNQAHADHLHLDQADRLGTACR